MQVVKSCIAITKFQSFIGNKWVRLVAIDISLVGWIAKNYAKTTLFLIICCTTGAFIVTFIVIWINRAAYQKIDDLEDL